MHLCVYVHVHTSIHVSGYMCLHVSMSVCVCGCPCYYVHVCVSMYVHLYPKSQTYLWRVVEVETREQPIIHKAQVGRVKLNECRHDLVIHIHWVLPNKTSTVHTLNHAVQQNIHSMHPKSNTFSLVIALDIF